MSNDLTPAQQVAARAVETSHLAEKLFLAFAARPEGDFDTDANDAFFAATTFLKARDAFVAQQQGVSHA